MKRWLLSSALVLLLILSLAACNSQREPQVIAVEGNREKTSVHFLTNTNNNWSLNAFKTVIASFQTDHPEVHIDFEGYNVGAGKSVQKLIEERMEAGIVEDMATMDVANIFTYADQGVLLDMTDTEAGRNMTELARADSSVKGHVMSVPLAMLSFGMYANMDCLNACGLDLPTNWEEFIHCCQVLQENGYQPILGTRTFPKLFVLAAMGDIYRRDDTDAIIQRLNAGQEKISDYARVGFDHLAYLIEKGYIDGPAAAQRSTQDLNAPYETGENGVFVLAASTYIHPSELPFDVAFIGIPGTQGMVSLMACDRRIVVMKDSPARNTCVDFLGYLSRQDVWDSLPDTFGLIPAYTTMSDTKGGDPRMAQVYENIEAGRTMLIQDYRLCFEQWGNLDGICDAMLTGASAADQAAAFDQLQQDAIAAAQ